MCRTFWIPQHGASIAVLLFYDFPYVAAFCPDRVAPCGSPGPASRKPQSNRFLPRSVSPRVVVSLFTRLVAPDHLARDAKICRREVMRTIANSLVTSSLVVVTAL